MGGKGSRKEVRGEAISLQKELVRRTPTFLFVWHGILFKAHSPTMEGGNQALEFCGAVTDSGAPVSKRYLQGPQHEQARSLKFHVGVA